jgi:acetylornithine deacetylase/succinyl-diaminopimelate desuccinylase-like protein
MSTALHILKQEAVDLLKELIAIPSFSREEDGTAAVLEAYLQRHGVEANRYMNNVWAKNKYFDESKPSMLLNSHHDTVKPNKAYTLNPFLPLEKEDRLYGLGSNDAGGCLVSILALFLHYYERGDLKYNLVFAATAEEENSGNNGIEVLLHQLPPLAFGLVGEPTLMHMAVAERGLMVLDVTVTGRAGHAAREEGENALYKALPDINWFQSFKFEKVSPLLGAVKMTVTVIDTENKAHNVVPPQCHFVVDTRVNELYSFEEILETIAQHVKSEVKPRSMRMRSTAIALNHPLVKAGTSLGRDYYGSPTTSDKALMPFPTLKIGPGDSARSHTADEFIYIREIHDGIGMFVELLNKIV